MQNDKKKVYFSRLKKIIMIILENEKTKTRGEKKDF